MHNADAFEKPPATVADACELFLQGKSIPPGDHAAMPLVDAVVFASFATAGRILSVMQRSADPCNAAADLLRVKQETERVVMEAAHVATISCKQSPND